MSPTLQLIDIPALELHVFGMIADLFNTWTGTEILQVILFEYNSENQGSPLVTLEIGRMTGNQSSPVAIEILEWRYSHISEVLEDWDAYVLYHATQPSCDSLVSLVLCTSLLTDFGYDCMQRVLQQSDPAFLSIECGTFDPSLESHLGQVLAAVNFSFLKSLVLFGGNIDGWINDWATHSYVSKIALVDAHLFRLSIVGFGGRVQ
ncbi:MAG: hypothetical protein BYD32DRAFT_462683 [Podila humilis]|nr:MAG: hypothetical protein BYD32DRAFT_462683 [Podila humilis]